MTKKKHAVARTLGYTYAHVQNGMDKIIEWSFKKMKEADKKKSKTKSHPVENKYWRATKSATRNTFSFLGSAGEAYYSKYSELKKKEEK